MMKNLICFFCVSFILISCQKNNSNPSSTTTNPVVTNPYQEVGLDKIGGNYSGGDLYYIDISDPNNLSEKDSSYSIDVTYLNNKINVTINTSLNIPNSLKQFSIEKKDITTNEHTWFNSYRQGTYTGDNLLDYNLIMFSNSYIWNKKTISITLQEFDGSGMGGLNYYGYPKGVEGVITHFYIGSNDGCITLNGDFTSGGYAASSGVRRNY